MAMHNSSVALRERSENARSHRRRRNGRLVLRVVAARVETIRSRSTSTSRLGRPSTAGAGLNIAPNGARLCKWLGVDLDGGDPKGPAGAIDGGRASILEATCQVMPDNTRSLRPIDHDTAARDGAGFHHMHRLDLLMCLHKRVGELGPDAGVECPIRVHMGKRLEHARARRDSVTARFADGSSARGDVLIGADGINSKVLRLLWPNTPPKRWTQVVVYRGLAPRAAIASLRKADGSPLDYNPIDSYTMDVSKNDYAFAMTYWVRGGELLNIALMYYEPNAAEFERDDWGDWFPIDHAEMQRMMSRAFGDDPRKHDVLALAGAMENPTKWGLYDRDAFEHWQDGRVCLLGDAAHPMLPTMGQGASQSFEDGAALAAASSCTARTSTARCSTTSACATIARRAFSSRRSSCSSTSSRPIRRRWTPRHQATAPVRVPGRTHCHRLPGWTRPDS